MLTTDIILKTFSQTIHFHLEHLLLPPKLYVDYDSLIIEPYAQRFMAAWEENPFISSNTKFSAKRSVSPEILTGSETLQTVTFEFTLEEALPAAVTGSGSESEGQ